MSGDAPRGDAIEIPLSDLSDEQCRLVLSVFLKGFSESAAKDAATLRRYGHTRDAALLTGVRNDVLERMQAVVNATLEYDS